MKPWRFGTALALIALLHGCGGGGSSGGGSPAPPVATTPPPPPATTAGCSLRERQDWAAAQLNEWYLFPETLPASPNPAGYSSVEAYIDYLTSVARAQNRDRYFTHITSIAEENAFYASGATAGFGFRLAYDLGQSRIFIAEAFENAPALAAGIDRGAELLAIGTNAGNMRTVGSILATEGTAGIFNALGPDTTGTTRVLRISDAGGTRDLTISKAIYDILPVSNRYGARIINDGGQQVGYVNLRTFISTADPALRQAFADFRAQGVTDLIIDLRYNGGGLVRIAELIGDLLGRNRTASDVFSFTTFRASKSANDVTRFFAPQPESVAPNRIAFIGRGGTASASELVINAMIPYLGNRAALIGANTYGKPVGQIAIDRAACDDRLRIVAFATQNSQRQGDYYNGLAGTVQASCQAADDLTRPLGDPGEASVARALDFLAQRACTPIGAAATAATETERFNFTDRGFELLQPERPNIAQRDAPGLF